MGKVTNTVLATSLAFSALIAPSTLASAETNDLLQATEQSQEQSLIVKKINKNTPFGKIKRGLILLFSYYLI